MKNPKLEKAARNLGALYEITRFNEMILFTIRTKRPALECAKKGSAR